MTQPGERRSVTFRTIGIARPKGSLRAFLRRGSVTPIVTHDNPKLIGWEQLVRVQAQHVAYEGLFTGPVAVAIVFRLPRPASLPARVRHHVRKPDIDKLARAVLDALTGVLFVDDRSVVDLRVRKCYVAPDRAPEACITVLEAAAPNPAQSSLVFALEQEDRCRM
jgi:Holliday junction resolvase RusA-like endonuclease